MTGGMRQILIGDVSLPLADFAIARTGVLGITRSGKTYGAKGVAEQLLDAGVPIVVFDAIGVWRFLKMPGTGPHAKGYPIVIAGGAAADLPLTPQSAPEIVRAAIAENIPLVVDMYSSKLSKADWRRIVQASFRTLLYENKGIRHVFLEEASEFAPQKILDGETYAEVEKLARMGGNVQLGITIINQRAQEVNKAVLELCDNLVLLRQRGSHAIDALEKWLNRVSPDVSREIAKSLPHMTAGECWVWTEESERPVRTRTRQLRSFHPDRRVIGEASAAIGAKGAVDTGAFVARLSGSLKDLLDRAKSEDPKELQREIARLRAELARKAPAPPPEIQRVEVSVLTQAEAAVIAGGLAGVRGALEAACGDALAAVRDVAQRLDRATRAPVAQAVAGTAGGRPVAPPAPPGGGGNGKGERVTRLAVGPGAALPSGERRILTALAQYPGGRSKKQVAILTGYAHTGGGFSNYLSSLRSKGLLEGGAERLAITDAGLVALGEFTPLPHGDALLQHWLDQLEKAPRLILDVLAKAYPAAMAKDAIVYAIELATNGESRYEPSGGGFNNALSRLRSLELISGKGALRASEDLFG